MNKGRTTIRGRFARPKAIEERQATSRRVETARTFIANGTRRFGRTGRARSTGTP